VLTEDGDVVLVHATPARHEEVARFAAIEGKTWNHPVIADGKLLVRNIQEMAAFDIR
jgi:outer membrane protein assembly factor BamB